MDMMQTEFEDSFFDGLVSFYSIYHIPNEYGKNVFHEFHRILKPNGKILLVTHKGIFTDTLRKLWGYDDLEIFATFYLEDEIERLFTDADFSIERLESKPTVYKFPKERIITLAIKQ